MVEAVVLLDELKGNADQKQFLQLLNVKALRSHYDWNSGAKTARNDEDVEEIPSIRTERSHTKATNSHDDVNEVDGRECEE